MYNPILKIKKFFNTKNELKKLKYQNQALCFEIKHAMSICEKYIPLMKTTDKIQLLILRRNLWTKN